MDFDSLLKTIFGFLKTENAYIVQIGAVLLAAFILDAIQRSVLRRLHNRLKKTRNKWDEAVIGAFRRPAALLVWVIGISFAVEIFQKEKKGAHIFAAAEPIRDTLIIYAFVWFLIRLIKFGENNFLSREDDDGIDKTTVNAISQLMRVAVMVTGILVAMQTLGYSVSGVLAFGGIGGIAVGFAAKDLLANFFGGLMLFLDRPFAVGDWVRSPDRAIEGTVEYIGWRLTRIRTFDARPLYVPNSVFANIAVENPSRMNNRRIYETIGMRYQDAGKMETVIQRVKEMLANHPEIDTGRTLIVNFNAFAPSSLNFFIYTFTKTTDWVHFHEVKQDVLLKILKIIEEEGTQIAFPTSTLHLKGNAAIPGIETKSQ